MADNTQTRSKTTATAALTTVLAGCLVALIASDLDSGLRYSLGAVVVVALLACAYRLGTALRSGR